MNNFLKTAFVAGAAMTMAMAPALADTPQTLVDMPLEQMLSLSVTKMNTVGFFSADTRTSPVYTYVIDQKTISLGPSESVADMLDFYAPGTNITMHGSNGPIIGQRGISTDSNAKAQITLDGFNITSRINGDEPWLASPLIGDIEQVDVVLGPGAITQGGGANNGLVNITPKSGKDYPGYRWDVAYEPVQDLKKYEMQYGMSKDNDKEDLFIYAGVAQATGIKLPSYPDGTGGEFTYVEGQMIHPSEKLSGYFKYDRFSLDAIFLRYFSRVPASWANENNPSLDPNLATNGVLSSYNGLLSVNPRYTWDLATQSDLTLDGGVVLQELYHIAMQDNLNPNAPGTNVNPPVVSKGSFFFWNDQGSELHLSLKPVYRNKELENNEFAIGVEAGHRFFYRNGESFFYDGWTDTNQIGSAKVMDWGEYSIFAEDTLTFLKKWSLTLGGREDVIDYAEQSTYFDGTSFRVPSGHPSHFSPRVSVAYEIDDTSSARLSYQQGFRWPDANEILGNLSAGAPIPGPEKVDSFDLHYNKKLEPLKMSLDWNGYYNINTGTLGWMQPVDNPNAPGGVYNSPRFSAAGSEIILKWMPIKKTEIQASYSFSRPYGYKSKTHEDPGGEGMIVPVSGDLNEWARYPDNIIKLDVLNHLTDKLSFDTVLQYRSPMKVDSYLIPTGNGDIFNKDICVVNAALKYEFKNGWYAKVSGQNIFKSWDYSPTWEADSNQMSKDWFHHSLWYLEVGGKF